MSTNLQKSNKSLIAVTIGDINGIGIHLLVKEFYKKKINNFVLITNLNIFYKNINFSKKLVNEINEDEIYKYNTNK